LNFINGDKSKLIDFSIKTVESLLNEFGEYFPCAFYVDINGELNTLLNHAGDENPSCESVIIQYQQILDNKIAENLIRSYAIAYDVRTQKNSSSLITDAIAIRVIHIETHEIIIYYYSYHLTSDLKLELKGSWGIIQE
jgi:hypothetical protein